ncbi:MAG: TetR family transcriptional regulator [Myxococcales bacterium]|nr:TetR family transcriptional regulator [Myxococcales bacterium]MCB9628867.1 TetR family transcriptional regulator [Sandaracinaceae bacterium]
MAARRPPLDREQVLASALALADRDGVERLTMRALATELGVSPMAVYWHFPNKAALVAELVDFVVNQYDVHPGEGGTLRERARKTFRTMYQGLHDHPGIIPLISQPETRGRSSLEVMNALLAQLQAEGRTARRAQEAYHLLMSFTLGAIAMSQADGLPARAQKVFEANLERALEVALA